MEDSKKICPSCNGFIPNNETPGAYPGAISRKDNKTEICSACGVEEAVQSLISKRDANSIAWQSTVTEEMITHLNENEISLLINALNDAVADICESYDIK